MRYYWLFISLFLAVGVSAQSKKDLEKKRLKLIQDIELTNKQIQKNKQSEELALKDLNLVNSQLEKRRQLIEVLNSEQKLLIQRKEVLEDSVSMLSKTMERQKKEYAQVLNQAHIRERMEHPFQSLAESANIFEGFKRWIYLGQLKNYVNRKWDRLQEAIDLLANQQLELEANINEQKSILADLRAEEKNISREKEEKDKLVKKLKANEKKLRADLKKKQAERNALNKEIEKLILAELSRKKKESADRTKVDIALSKDFASNKGKLPWPVANGVITSRFGRRAHPVLKGIYVDNSGVDFLVKDNSVIKAVFDGSVVGSTTLPGQDNMVIISHGEFFTVYSKLSQIQVRVGQTVKRGSVLGSSGPARNGESNFHFEIWQKKEKLNPQIWLRN